MRRFSWLAVPVVLVTTLVAGSGGRVVNSSASTGKVARAAFSVQRVTSVANATGTEYVMTIAAKVDGRSILQLSGHTARWSHLIFAAPGRHEGANEPTRLGLWYWFPGWPQPGENRDCKCHSTTFEDVYPALPAHGKITFTKVNCRETCTGTAGNGKARIVFDDRTPGGDALYTVTLTFQVTTTASAKVLFKGKGVSASGVTLKNGGVLQLCSGDGASRTIYVAPQGVSGSKGTSYNVKATGCSSIKLLAKGGKPARYLIGTTGSPNAAKSVVVVWP